MTTPGCPDFDFSMASIPKKRMALTDKFDIEFSFYNTTLSVAVILHYHYMKIIRISQCIRIIPT